MLRSLRGRLTAGIVLVLAVVLAAAGVVVARAADRNDRQVLDDRLRRTAELSRATALATLEQEVPTVTGGLDAVLDASGSSLRLSLGDVGLLETGTGVARTTFPGLGLRTVTLRGRRYRVFSERVPESGLGDLAVLQVTTSLRSTEARQDRLRRQLAGLGLGVLLLAAAGTWLAATRVLRPLARLRRSTAAIATDEDLSRRVPVGGARELAELAGDFNGMLERLGRSAEERTRALEATRRFAADAGHELRSPLTAAQTTLSILARHPGLDPARRTALAEDALAEQRRLVALLDGLQALARGDASEVADAPCDLDEVVDAAVVAARARHPGTTFTAELGEEPVVVSGWEPGLRLIADNLLENAARHGRPGGGHVRVELGGAGPRLVVDDDGPGVSPADRERIFAPFARVLDPDGPERPGSGLGLALVAQQVAHHGASVRVEDAPGLGGARVVVDFGARGLSGR